MMSFGWRLNPSFYLQNAQPADQSLIPMTQTGALAPESLPVLATPTATPIPAPCPSITWFYALAAGAAIAGLLARGKS